MILCEIITKIVHFILKVIHESFKMSLFAWIKTAESKYYFVLFFSELRIIFVS